MQMNAPPLAARECVAPVPLGDTVPAEDAALSASLKEPTNGPGGAVVVRTLRISDILRDSRLQVREGLDEGTIRRYADGMKAGVEFPPIKVARINGAYVLVDGWHRLEATASVGQCNIEAETVPVADFEQAGWLAAAANLAHGLPLKRREGRAVFRAYVKARQYYKGRTGKRIKSAREIAADLQGLASHKTILEWMKQDANAVYRLMTKEESSMTKRGKPRDPDEHFIGLVMGAIEDAANGFKGIISPDRRGELIAQMRATLAQMEAAGQWVEPPPEEESPF
jgi:hypothetical protein